MQPSDARARLVVFATVVLAVVIGGVGLAIALFSGRSSTEPAPPPAGFLAAALARAQPAGEPFPELTEVRLGVGADCLHLVVADAVEERVDGLRDRTDLGAYDGMLFVFDAPSNSSFTMSGVTTPLDIGWYSAFGRPVGRAEMEPCPSRAADCPAYSAGTRYRFAVETLGGELPAGALSGCS
ncbi:MAG: DUF192 domain-containing protein [Acidimicrobiia bacterium]